MFRQEYKRSLDYFQGVSEKELGLCSFFRLLLCHCSWICHSSCLLVTQFDRSSSPTIGLGVLMINVTTQREKILPNYLNNRNMFLTETTYSFSLQACQDSYFTFIRPTQNNLIFVISHQLSCSYLFHVSR